MSLLDYLFGIGSHAPKGKSPEDRPPEPDPEPKYRAITVRHWARSTVVGGDVYIRVVDLLDLLNKTRSAWGPFSMVLPHQVTDFLSGWLRDWSEGVEQARETSARDGAHAATDSGSDEGDVDDDGEPIGDDEYDEIDREIAEIEREVEAARAVRAEDEAEAAARGQP